MKSRFIPFQFLFTEATEGGDGGGGSATAAAATTTATQAAAPVHFNPDGTFADNWPAALGDDFAPHAEALKPFKDVKGLAKSYLHFRANGPAYPDENASPEDVTRFHSIAKVPAEGTPAAYGITLPPDIADTDKAMYDRIAKAAHAAHAPAPVVAAIVGEYRKMQEEVISAHQAEQQTQTRAATDALIGKWGADFEGNKSIARHTLSTLAAAAGIPGDDPNLAPLLDNPALAQIAVEFSRRVSEDPTRTPGDLNSLRSAQDRANSIMDGSDSVWGKKYTEGTTEEQRAAYQEVARLLNEARK